MRLAGSPVHVSSLPRIAKLTPASCNSVATARVVFFALSSKAPAQPTQKRYSNESTSSALGIGKSRPLVHSSRVLGAAPQGFPLASRLRSIAPASLGNELSIITWYRRMSTMWSTCSMSTGHCSTQAPHVVQDQSASCAMTASSPPTSGVSNSLPACSFAYAWSRNESTTSLGDNGLPVFQAGHWDWQRPHSVHVEKSRRPFQVKSSIFETPKVSFSGSASSKSSTWPPDIIGLSEPKAGLPSACRLKKMLGKASNRCHATPIVTLSPTVIAHAMLTTIFVNAIQVIAFLLAGNTFPSACDTGAAHIG